MNINFDYDAMHQEELPFAENLASWIHTYIKPQKVLDIGCGGTATYVEAMRSKGINAKGYDPNPMVRESDYVRQVSMFELNEVSDLVICLEVAEHIHFIQSDEIVSKLCSFLEKGGSLIFSAAQPGQGGVGHINCQYPSFWEEKFLARPNIYRNRIAESTCREVVFRGPYMGWFRNNFMIFSKG